MAGRIAPAVTPRAQWDGQAIIPASPLIITPGSGVLGRTDTTGSRLLLDVPLTEPAETFSLFRPGAVAAATLGVWANRFRSAQAYLRALEVNLGTAPSAGDASNYWRVKVADSLGSTVVLPISAAGVAHYVLDQGIGVAIGGTMQGNTAWSSGTVYAGAAMWGERFALSQPVSVTGARVGRVAGWAVQGNPVAMPTTIAIVDAAGAVMASGSAVVAASAPNSGWAALSVAFPVAVVLPVGTYWLIVDPRGYTGQQQFNIEGGTNGAGTQGWGPVSITDVATTIRTLAVVNTGSPAIPAAFPYSSFIAGGAPSGYTAASNAPSSSPAHVDWSLLGSPSGAVQLAASLTLSVDAVGTPAAGAAGVDLNVRALVSP